ncbi:nucleoside/nucleotide kinase family protein [Actinocatenispora rupis]|uniref:Nucleoside/nucleotide kinase family protein n=1 Tax=Actinocatenispora rupis TaxID=519421 RepID=A0A8J3NBI6_9ACTN|nr:nucleoside/nucleotide kinase family protein [Actinocatenispora rupis]
MSGVDEVADLPALVDRARRLAVRPGPALLGITGAPAAGKSTLAAAVVAAVDGAVLVPMDGFHLANAELDRLGRRDRKGAPDTFDAAGYVAVLRRIRYGTDPVVYAPRFHREVEESYAGEIAVERARTRLVVTEGNYLLLPTGPWSPVAGLLDESWYVELADEVRLRRLVDRHVAYGREPAAARAWACGTDQVNAELVATTRGLADLVVRLDSGSGQE